MVPLVRFGVAVLACLLAFGCANGRDRDRYDDRYRNDPYYGHPQSYPVPYGHRGHESRLERHQEREWRSLEHEQKHEDKALKKEQKSERRGLKDSEEWDKQDKQRQREERKALELEQKDERQDLKRHQKRERQDYWH